MKTLAFIQKCISAVPVAETWRSVESYGITSNAHWPKNVKKVLYCVSGSSKIDEYARANGYDAVIQHHPMYTENHFPTLTFHTALDCCKGGLNDMWAEALGVSKTKHISENLGWVGRFNRPTTFGTLMAKVERFIGQKIVGNWACEGGFNKQIKTISICTGLGGMITNLVTPHKADCYLTGELTHSGQTSMAAAVIEIGHTLSERCGHRFFEKLLKKDGVKVDLCPLKLDVFGSESSKGKETTRPWPVVPQWDGSTASRDDEGDLDSLPAEAHFDGISAKSLQQDAGNALYDWPRRDRPAGEFLGTNDEIEYWEPTEDNLGRVVPAPERWCQHGVNTNKFDCPHCPQVFDEKTDK